MRLKYLAAAGIFGVLCLVTIMAMLSHAGGPLEGPFGVDVKALCAHGATAKKTAAYTVGADNACECYGGIIYVTSAATITACDNIVDTMGFTVITVGNIEVSVDPQDDDLIVRDGVAQADGQAITNTSTAGDITSCSYYDATGWYCSTNNWTGP